MSRVYIHDGLKPLTYDKRDFNHAKLFGGIKNDLPGLPKEGLGRKPISIKDQEDSNYCTAFTVSEASEYQEGVELSPEYQTAKVGQIVGQPIFNGAQPRDAMKSATVYGSLEKSVSPYIFQNDGWQYPAQYQSYNTFLDEDAKVHKKGSYFSVTWGWPDDLDPFDSARLALWQAKNEKGVVMVFGLWYGEFNNPENGIVPVPVKPFITRHAYIVYDWCEKNGIIYLKAQLSQGKDFGDEGTLYMSREAFNASLIDRGAGTGMYIFRDLDAANLKSNKVNLTWWDIIKKIFNRFV